MEYFLDTTDSVVDGLGFSHYDGTHIAWLTIFAIVVVLNALLYHRLSRRGQDIWNKTVAWLIVLDEVFKVVMLIAGGRYTLSYLPLHLCSINIFVILLHAYRSSKLLDNFLYTVCIPGAIAALLFPTWTKLPVMNFMHLHSFSVHILLAMYPLVLATNKKMNITYKWIPRCLGLLLIMVIPIYGINLLFDTNFMFLMSADKGNPLYWFGQNWGNHLFGFPVLIAAILIVMYVPLELTRKLHNKKRSD